MNPELREFLERACKHLDVHYLCGYLDISYSGVKALLFPRVAKGTSPQWVAVLASKLRAERPAIEAMMKKRRYRFVTPGPGVEGRFI